MNNLIFTLAQYGAHTKIPTSTRDIIESKWKNIVNFLSTIKDHSYILTNNLYESTRDKTQYERVKFMAQQRGSIFIPIRLLIDQDEHFKRITDPNRRILHKTIDPQYVGDEKPLLSISHPHLLEINVSNLSPTGAAEALFKHIHKVIS